ncbi:MAG: PH domain-containing protein [bacterium]
MSGPAGGGRGPATQAPAVPVVRFQLPRSAYLAVLFLGLGLTPLVRSSTLIPLYLIPVAVGIFVARRATLVDAQRVRVQALLGSRSVPWVDVRGVLIRPRGAVALVERGGSSLRLPYVRVRHLPLLAELSSGRLPNPAAEGDVAVLTDGQTDEDGPQIS